MKRTMMAACILSLVACGGSKDDVATDQRQDWESRVQSLVYSFPDNAQQEVPTSSPVVLRFSSPVRTGNAALHDKIVLRDSNNTKIEWADIEEVDNGQSLLLHPQQKLSPLTTYQLSIAPIELQKGETRARNLTFSTRAAYEGPKSLVADDEFTILRTLPNDLTYGATDTPVDIMEFTTFRVQFSQPLDRSTVKYGDVPGDSTVQLTGPDGLIDAHVIVSGPYLTIDPKEDLQPDVPHRITFTTGVKSIYGDTMPGGSFGNENDTTAKTIDFTPKATGPRGNMVQDIADTLGKVSPLTGRQINEVPMASVLLGEDTATQASGIVAAELAFVPDFPDATPLRVKRGSLIEGASIDVLIGGEVPAGFESGKVRMDFLSDATGYLLPNPYSDTDDAPRQVRLWMDVAVSTETPQANGAITQDLLHIELVGTSLVDPDTKLMTINAVGVVEPNVLGSEYASGLLSFYMEEVGDQDNPPVMVEDTTGPVLQSWIPGENAHLHKPGDPIIFNFNEAIDPESVKGKVRLFHNDNPMEIDYYVDGSALVIKPEAVLQYSPYENPFVYRVEIYEGVFDLAGNQASQLPFVEEFELSKFVDIENLSDFLTEPTLQNRLVEMRKTEHAPLVLAAYPGYPCALMQEYYDDLGQGDVDSTRDLSNNQAGLCAGSFPGLEDGTERDRQPADDIIPVMDLPANHPIIVSFSKNLKESSVVFGKTFKVEKITEDGVPIEVVDGELSLNARSLTFYPNEGWDEGVLYKYSILSSGYEVGLMSGTGSSNTIFILKESLNDYECGVDTICDEGGLPLQTQVLGPVTIRTYNANGSPTGNDRDYKVLFGYTELQAGGPDFVHFFRGAKKNNSVLQHLTTQPVSDVNGNFMSEVSNIGTAPFQSQPGMNVGLFDYPHEEVAAFELLEESDQGRYPEYDPDGLKPIENSAKMLSRFANQAWNDEFFAGGNGRIVGLNFGCGYDQTSLGPITCPKHKFTYLISSIIAEVTDVKDLDGNVMVKMWPSMVVGTSMGVYAPTQVIPGFYFATPGETGKQVLRMRFGGDGGYRNNPIIGWIYNVNEKPIMKAVVDLYVDTPFAPDWALGAPAQPINMRSYPISMKLEGNVEFLPDGRMAVEQFNTEPVDIQMLIHGPNDGAVIGYADIFIPEFGSRLNFLSRSIK